MAFKRSMFGARAQDRLGIRMELATAANVMNTVSQLAGRMTGSRPDPTIDIIVAIGKNIESINNGLQTTIRMLADIQKTQSEMPQQAYIFQTTIKLLGRCRELSTLMGKSNIGMPSSDNFSTFKRISLVYEQLIEYRNEILSLDPHLQDQMVFCIPLLFSTEMRAVSLLSNLETGLNSASKFDPLRVDFDAWRAALHDYLRYCDRCCSVDDSIKDSSPEAVARSSFFSRYLTVERAFDAMMETFYHPAIRQDVLNGNLSIISARVGCLELQSHTPEGGFWGTDHMVPRKVRRTFLVTLNDYKIDKSKQETRCELIDRAELHEFVEIYDVKPDQYCVNSNNREEFLMCFGNNPHPELFLYKKCDVLAGISDPTESLKHFDIDPRVKARVIERQMLSAVTLMLIKLGRLIVDISRTWIDEDLDQQYPNLSKILQMR